MIRRVVDFALNNRLLVLGFGLLLFAGGIVSFERLPIEAYPDVADNYVEIITQWPGISAEQIEQQVTIPLEVVMNGIPQVVHLRSFSLFGLSDLKLIFEDGSDNAWNRERVLERLAQATLPPGVVPQMGTDWSPVGQIYFFTLHSSNPAYDAMELKSIEDWVVEKSFKSVPNIVDVASFGGPTREYQGRVGPKTEGSSITTMWCQASCSCGKAQRPTRRSRASTKKWKNSTSTSCLRELRSSLSSIAARLFTSPVTPCFTTWRKE